MIQKGIFRWLSLDMLIFAAANIFLILRFENRLCVLNDIGYFKLLVFGLAVFRAANILSNEAVTRPLRAPFVDETRKGGKLVQLPKKFGFLGAIGLLIYCPSCTGVWIATSLVYFYVFYPEPTFAVVLFLALSSLERIISGLMERLKAVKR